MKDRRPRAVVSFLWDKHLAALDEFLRTTPSVKCVVTPEAHASEWLRQITSERGRRLVTLEELLADVDVATLAAPKVAALVAALDESEPDRDLVVDHLTTDIPVAVATVEALRRASQDFRVSLFATSEDVTRESKVAAVWAKDHGVPSLHLAHSIALVDPYTVHAHLATDILAVYGERGAEGYLDLGIPADRIVVTGNPAWDRYADIPGIRLELRDLLREKHGLAAALPLVTFGTTWSARMTALDTGHAFADTLAAFVTAAAELTARGVEAAYIVKDRPTNAAFGEAALAGMLQKWPGLADRFTYTDEDTEAWAVASDLMIGVDSNYLVEAMLSGTPGINLTGVASLPQAPAFDASSGVIEAEAAGLADAIARVLADPEGAEGRRASLLAAAPYYQVNGPDGMAKDRVAAELHGIALVPANLKAR